MSQLVLWVSTNSGHGWAEVVEILEEPEPQALFCGNTPDPALALFSS